MNRVETMKKRKHKTFVSRRSKNRWKYAPDVTFQMASEAWENGQVRRAFHLFLEAARRRDSSSQLNVGYFYDNGIGVRVDKNEALTWYRRAYRGGDSSGAKNIGLIWLERGDIKRAQKWLERAVMGGVEDSRLHLAKICLMRGRAEDAADHLRRVVDSHVVSMESQRQARATLRSLTHRARPTRSK
jgi:TPR repeat protein